MLKKANKNQKKLIALLMAFAMVLSLSVTTVINVNAEGVVTRHYNIEEKYSIYQAAGKYLADNNPSITYVDSTGAKVGKEGYLIALARSGYPVSGSLYSGYYRRVKKYLAANNNTFESVTECAKVVAALNAIGYDPTNIDGVDITKQLNDAKNVSGAYGYAYSLIAMDTKNYALSNRDTYIKKLVEDQLTSGAWGYDGKTEDIDTTGMVLAALAPYYDSNKSVTTAVNKALDYVSKSQNSDGSFSSWGNANSNTTAMVVLGLSELRIDPEADERFIKNGVSAVDALCSFAIPSGGFGWLDNTEVNDYATYQSYYSLCAYARDTSNHNRLFDMSAEVVSDNVAMVDEEQGVVIIIDPVKGSYQSSPIDIAWEGMVYRMYDPNRGEHFYTKNSAEATQLESLGWQHEANADFRVGPAMDKQAVAVYRLYNPNGGGMHFYTENPAEAKSLSEGGWNYEGISHYVYNKDAEYGVAQYRLYNPNNPLGEHNWTADEGEKAMLVNAGWTDEGACWKVI